MRKRLRLVATAILVLVSAGGLCVYLGQEGRLSTFNFERIKDGMHRTEVIEILGEPMPMIVSGEPFLWWREGPDEILVEFDDSGQVSKKSLTTGTVWERTAYQIWNRMPVWLRRADGLPPE